MSKEASLESIMSTSNGTGKRLFIIIFVFISLAAIAKIVGGWMNHSEESVTAKNTIGQSRYLALEDGPPMFRQSFSCSVLLDFTGKRFSCTGLSPTMAALSRAFH